MNEKVARVLAEQRHIEAVVAGTAPRCGTVRTLAGTPMTCIRPPHGGQHPNVDNTRRRQGQSVAADRHTYVALEAS